MSEDFMSDTERWPSVPVPLRPGSVSFHHSMTMHKSGANTSGLRRRGYAIHYMRATSVPEGEITSGAKVSGQLATCIWLSPPGLSVLRTVICSSYENNYCLWKLNLPG